MSYMLDMARYLTKHPGIGARLEQMGCEQALQYLQTLPEIGKVTKYHLARNIGLDVVNPNRHLTRLAEVAGTTPEELCRSVAKAIGERVGVVDYVFYQWCVWAGLDEVAETARAICTGQAQGPAATFGWAVAMFSNAVKRWSQRKAHSGSKISQNC